MYYANSIAVLVDGEVQTVPILDTTKAPAIIETASGETVSIQDSAVEPFSGLKIFGKATQDGTPSPESPVPIEIAGSGGTVNVNITGNQLFDASKLPSKTQSGATVTNNGDGSFTITGSGEFTGSFSNPYALNHQQSVELISPGNIYLKSGNTNPRCLVQLNGSNGLITSLFDGSSYEITSEVINDPEFRITFYINRNSANNTIVPGTIKPILFQNGDGTWEPFQAPQQLPLSTPNGLPGVPVTSGGNYTDATGQQWISDVIDLEAGTYTQNYAEIVFDGSEDEKWVLQAVRTNTIQFSVAMSGEVKPSSAALCDRFECINDFADSQRVIIASSGAIFVQIGKSVLSGETANDFKTWLQSNPITVLYQLATPVVTQLSSEEIAAYKALLSNYPSTNIFSDSTPQVGIEASYTADTKTYIDNKFNAVAQQMLNQSGGN